MYIAPYFLSIEFNAVYTEKNIMAQSLSEQIGTQMQSGHWQTCSVKRC